MIRRGVMAALLCGLLAVPAVQAAEPPVVLVADPWCPHTCDPDDGSDGYMVDIAREAFAMAGIPVVYKTLGWARAMRDVRQGRADGAVGALADEAPDLITHVVALGWQANVLIIRDDDPWVFTGLASLVGRQVGSVSSYSYSAEIDAWLAANPATVQAISGSNAAGRNLKKLLARRIDIMLDDEAVVGDAISRQGQPPAVRIAGNLPGGTLHIAFAPQRGRTLAAILDRNIKVLRANGRLAAILAHYGLSDWERR
jgi:polar amino acid transport system substrate-binding protein